METLGPVPIGAESHHDLIHLLAGPISASFEPETGTLRYIRVGGVEVLRSIYAAVRDDRWRTVTARVECLTIVQEPDAFRIGLHAVCDDTRIGYSWDCDIIADVVNGLRYRFRGVARTAFRRNRIGLCVLHPMQLSGHACRVNAVDGSIIDGCFPTDLAPHQPFLNMAGISHEVSPGVTANVTFHGDVFEMEDQRNWTDASYKTYSTPLSRPFPVDVEPGEIVSEEVCLRLTDLPLQATKPVLQSRVKVAPGKAIASLPAIGFGVGGGPLPRESDWRSQVNALAPAWLRLDWVPGIDGADERIEQAADLAASLGGKLEIALHLGSDAEEELERVAAVMAARTHTVARMLVLSRESQTTPESLFVLARSKLAPLFGQAQFGAGTDRFFTEFNRGRPCPEQADFLSFSLNPQVHVFDNRSIMETLAAQPLTVQQAVKMGDGRAVFVGPVTFRPRPDPAMPEMSSDPDRRIFTLFGAAWSLGTIAELSRAGAAGITMHEVAGAASFLAGGSLPPLWHLLAALAEERGATVLDCDISDFESVAGLVLETTGGRTAFLANLTPDPVCLEFDCAGRQSRVHIDMLDDRRSGFGAINIYETGDRTLDVALGPYAISRIREARK